MGRLTEFASGSRGTFVDSKTSWLVLIHGLGSEPGPGFHVRRVELCPQMDKTLTFCKYTCPASIPAR